MNTRFIGALGLGALAIWLIKKPSQAASPLAAEGQLVSKNGHTWELVVVPNEPGMVGAIKTNVFAPAGSWGPHQRLLVVSFSTAIAPNAQPQLSGVGADVPVAMRDAAIADLGIQIPGA